MTDAAAAFLAHLTGAGVEIGSAAADTPAAIERVIGYLPVDEHENKAEESLADLEEFLALLARNYPADPPPVMQTEILLEEDWSRNWKKHFTVLSITPRIVIKPTWESCNLEDDSAGKGKAVIEMDPGLAFGTGHHASTRLALLLIDEMFSADGIPEKVLDIGTGTGILAMACALLGSSTVTAVDNDPDAVAAAQENVRGNRLEAVVAVSGAQVSSLEGKFDLILANITHETLQALATDIFRHLHPGGRLILSGILRGEQEESITLKYTGLGMTHKQSVADDEWVALIFVKDAAGES
jgi:ribosomal protein L11 methyltransferase